MEFLIRHWSMKFGFKKSGLFFTKKVAMRHILILNSKGGCGKSTIATSLAGYFASEGRRVGLADYDPQESSLAWLNNRPEKREKIIGIAAHQSGHDYLSCSSFTY
jgi:cellulose biosynthesis protein BcsQ